MEKETLKEILESMADEIDNLTGAMVFLRDFLATHPDLDLNNDLFKKFYAVAGKLNDSPNKERLADIEALDI